MVFTQVETFSKNSRKFASMIDYKKHISIDSSIRFGKPLITGTRISVYDVLNWFANGLTIKDIIADFPELTKEQIQACLAYAADREHKLRVA
jgi:uncharacterized protein (DUF433 family)